MNEALWVVGDALTLLRELPDRSIDSVVTSPPYLAKRAYLPDDHPDKAQEIGQEAAPADFLRALLALTDELWRVVKDEGTIWFNLGDTASGSGGAGGDYAEGGRREGKPTYKARWSPDSWPRKKSVAWLPELFGASLAYGRNLLAPDEPCRQWVTRPQITWCKPSPNTGKAVDKFQEATELIVWASKIESGYYFNRGPLLLPLADSPGNRYPRKPSPREQAMYDPSAGVDDRRGRRIITKTYDPADSAGVMPGNWWNVPTSPGVDGHQAPMPADLVVRPMLASCPPGGTILDPFGGSGTTAMVATGNERNCLSFDLDARNVDLARDRIGPMFFKEADVSEAAAWLST